MRNDIARPASLGRYRLGEGPVWDADRERVLWIDVSRGTVFSGTLDGRSVIENSAVHVDETVGAVAVSASGDLLVAGRHDLHVVDRAGRSRRVLMVVQPDKASRLNDGGCDPAGRFVVGSLRQDDRVSDECLYRWDQDAVTVLDDDLTLSNGLAWSADGTAMYSVDTIPGVIWSRPYDSVTGACGPRTEFLRCDDGKPDGLCLDVDGNIWVAMWGAGQVRCYRPDGAQIAVVDVPAPHTSSVAFVGPHRDLLLITTARDELSEAQLEEFPDSGRLFIADVGVRGLPTHPWRPHPSGTTSEWTL
ncbi:MAG TPA: gluconolactonase [Propionibacteriaceae bacterium]|jgi:sugar lactone lactonase YvrE|nr:gluconolactonase [Propionibacteriaceae bacterium]HBY24805.1 gluconolactonase [Propionibacteriaceae bacterium]